MILYNIVLYNAIICAIIYIYIYIYGWQLIQCLAQLERFSENKQGVTPKRWTPSTRCSGCTVVISYYGIVEYINHIVVYYSTSYYSVSYYSI